MSKRANSMNEVIKNLVDLGGGVMVDGWKIFTGRERL